MKIVGPILIGVLAGIVYLVIAKSETTSDRSVPDIFATTKDLSDPFHVIPNEVIIFDWLRIKATGEVYAHGQLIGSSKLGYQRFVELMSGTWCAECAASCRKQP